MVVFIIKNKMGVIKSIFLTLYIVSISTIAKPQELIQNGDFELTYRESHYLLFNAIKYWYKPTWSSTDYQTNKHHWKEYHNPAYSGDTYMGIVVGTSYNYQEYGTNKLSEKLLKDSLYCLSMYVCLGNSCTVSINGVDALFTSKRIKVFTRKSLANKYYPDIKLGDFYITNKRKWIKISGVYKAKGGERYLTIGNFSKSDSILFPELLRKSKIYEGYLLIDNVSLIPIHNSSQCDCNIKRISIESVQNDSAAKDTQDKVISREGTIISLKNLCFDNDSYKIKPESFEELDKLYTLLKSNLELKISVNGYTDNIGKENHNQWLSEQRAKSVVDYLVQKGIQKERLSYKGYGMDNPIKSNETEEGRTANRRVEIELVK